MPHAMALTAPMRSGQTQPALLARLSAMETQLRERAGSYAASAPTPHGIADLLAEAQHALAQLSQPQLGAAHDDLDLHNSPDQWQWQGALLQAMTDASPVGYYVVDHRNDTVLFANRRFFEIWQLPDEMERINAGVMTHRELLPAQLAQIADVAGYLQSCAPLQDTEQRSTLQDEILLKDGRVIRRFSTQIRDDEGHYCAQVYDFFDITERKRIEVALRESEQRYRDIFESLQDVYFRLDLDGNIRMMSPSITATLGYAANELQGKQASSLLVDAHTLPRIGRRLIKQGHCQGEELCLRHKNGKRILGEVNAHLIYDDAGRPVAAQGTLHDITRHKEMEEALQQSRQRLRALTAHLHRIREEEQTRLARHIHDILGHALAALKMDLSWVQRQLATWRPDGMPRPLQQRIEGMFHALDDNIAQVRQISAELRPALLDTLGLQEAIEWSTQQFRARSGIPCRFQRSAEAMQLPVFISTVLYRICQELLTNVAQYAQASDVEVAITIKEDTVLLFVHDNGVGISAEEIAAPTSLGLIGIRERVLLLHGEFSITGRPNDGTTALVRIPLTPVGEEAE